MSDFVVVNHGTVWTFQMLTPEAREWVSTNVDLPDYMGTPTSFAADWRQGRDLVEGLEAAGFSGLGN